MRRAVCLAVVAILAMAAQSPAQQPTGSVENLREKKTISDDDRQQMRQWLGTAVPDLVTGTDPDRRRMVAAREKILNEVRTDANRSPAFVDAMSEETVEALKQAEKKAVGPEARLNLMMTVAGLRRLEAVPMLRTALEKDPYPASRYWAAKGLAMVADVVVEKVVPHVEQDMADSAAKALDTETVGVALWPLFEMLGKFDHERAHDVLADGVVKVAMRLSASDPMADQMFSEAIRSLERAYGREVRPEGKARLLTAYATLCAWLMPPVADPSLMVGLNASLEKITGEGVGFPAAGGPVLQKLALLEWVEKLVRDKRISKRPSLPPAVEASIRELTASETPPGAPNTETPTP
jgi:hypothetical protein